MGNRFKGGSIAKRGHAAATYIGNPVLSFYRPSVYPSDIRRFPTAACAVIIRKAFEAGSADDRYEYASEMVVSHADASENDGGAHDAGGRMLRCSVLRRICAASGMAGGI